jgi:hypothetical protein
MSNVIDFLEKWGQDSQLRHATSAEVEQALLRAGIEPAERAAILGADRFMLESLLGARSRIVCVVLAPEEEDEEEPKLKFRAGRQGMRSGFVCAIFAPEEEEAEEGPKIEARGAV